MGKIVKKCGGTFLVLAGNAVKRAEYVFPDHRANVVSALDEYAKAAVDAGISRGFHQHAGAAVESRDGVYALMDSVDTRYLKFAPDVGQLQNGGADAARVIKDFASITAHMHLKDFSGGSPLSGYCPLGEGKVDLVSILDTMENAGRPANIMVELDRASTAPIPARATAVTAKAFLQKLAFEFRG